MKSPRLKFEQIRLQISPAMETLPKIIPNEVEVCGQFLMSSSLKPGVRLPSVEVVSGPTIEASIAEDSMSAKFCFYLSPNKHILRLAKSSRFVRFAPASINVCISFITLT